MIRNRADNVRSNDAGHGSESVGDTDQRSFREKLLFFLRQSCLNELTGVIAGDVQMRDLTTTGMKTDKRNSQGNAHHRCHSVTSDITD